jgi:hypothetical protein
LLKDSKQKLIKKCTPLSDVVQAIKDKKFVRTNVCESLEQECLKVPAQLFQRILDLKGEK